jgi:hypothetical protein
MTDVEHYTTLTVEEYSHMANVILALREKVQRARQLIENKCIDEALEVLKKETE